MTREPLLACRGLEVSYGPVQVLFGVDLDIASDEVVALLGTNGAGKSTVLKAISGLLSPSAGTIRFDGTDITRAGPIKTAKAGIVHVPGGRAVFPTLTVAEHFRAGAWLAAGEDPTAVAARTEEVLALFPRVRERWAQQAGNLSGGEQQQLALGMAFAAKPRLLIIDELSLGLAPAIVETLLEVVRKIHAQGCPVILVEQSLNVALGVAARAYFMEKGEVRFAGPTAELLERDDLVRSVFLATPRTEPVAAPHRLPARGKTVRVEEEAAPALQADHLVKAFGGIHAVDDVSISLATGQILGLLGPNGAGKTTIFDLISGVLPVDGGSLRLHGNDITRWGGDRRAAAGLGRSFQDARIFPSLTVAENVAVALERHLDHRDHVATLLCTPATRQMEEGIARRVEELLELMGLGAYRDKFASELSTGSRRVVDLAMALAHAPSVLLLDEPSSGIAQRETEALAPLLRRIRDETGAALLVIEHDMPLLSSVCDEVVALELGRVVTRGTPAEVLADPRVVSAYLGGNVDTIHRSGRRGGVRKRSRSTTRSRA